MMKGIAIRIALAAAVVALGFGEAAGSEERSKQLLTQAQVEQTLHGYIAAKGPWKADQIEVKALSFKPVALSGGDVALRILKHGKLIGPGVQSFLVATDVGGKEERQLWVRADIKVFDQVVVSTRPLASREVIAAEDVRLDWREIGTTAPRAYTKIEEVLGKQVSRSTSANEVLTIAQAESPQVVRHGGAIVLIYENAYLRVETAGEALQAGKVGDTIKVKNPASGKLLQGIIVDARTVRVQ
jgi:flagella basal body P-ring formation protein FlgA